MKLTLFIVAATLLATPVSPAGVGALPASDAELASVVRQVLERDPELRRTLPRISARDGEIRLQGAMSSLSLRREAVRRTAAVRGVLAVDDAMRIDTGNTGDAALETRLWHRLSLYTDLRSPHLTLSVQALHVQAAGSVGTIGRLLFLEHVIASVEGVAALDTDAVKVRAMEQDTPPDAEGLRRTIQRLIRDPYQFPISGRIEVVLEGDKIVLQGRVPRLIDRMEAMRVAGLVTRSLLVVDRLTIDPSMGRLRIHSPSQ